MTRLVLCLVGPCLMALVVGTVGLRLGEDVPPPARRTSTTAFGKLAALGVCVQPVSGSHQEAEAVVGRVAPALDGLGQPLTRLFTVPALIDVGCPGEPAHDGAADRTRHVAQRSTDPLPRPSLYHLHVFVVPRAMLAVLPIDPDLAYRQAEVEEYASDQPEADGPARARVTLGLYATSDELVATPSLEQFLSRSLGLQRIARGVAPGPR